MNDSNWPLILTLAVALATLAGVLLAARVRAKRRAREFARPFPAEWRALLQERLPLYGRMPADLRLRLEPLVRAFLARVEFIGCQGLVITDDVRLMIATQACLLVVKQGPGAYGDLRSVLVYPDEFVVEESEQDEAGVVTEGTRILSGQTFETARIILSWNDVLESSGAGEPYNVVLHEFAHYLDHMADGALTSRGAGHRSLESWHAVLEREYEALCEAVDRDETTLIDPYGAEHLEEFFAVATETFFEAPREMQRRHSQLYKELRDFYALDPALW